MYSESDFESFSKKIITAAYKRADTTLDEAKKRAGKIAADAKREAELVAMESEEALERELKAYEKEYRSRIESEIAKEWSGYLSEVRSKIVDEIEKRLEERFDELAQSFLTWIAGRYKEGEIQIYEGVDSSGLKGFDILKTAEKRAVFSTKNLFIELSPASLVEEYSSLIEEEIAKKIGT